MANIRKAEAALATPATEIPVVETTEASMQDTSASVPAPEKKHREKKVIRTIEDLNNVAAKKMNPDEAAKYIDFMRDECTQLQEQLRSMTLNAQSSYTKAANATANLEATKRKAASEIAFAKQSIGTCYAAVLRCEIPNMGQNPEDLGISKYGVKEG